MTITDGLVIACGLALGYWFVSNFIRGSDPDEQASDREAARERPDGVPGVDDPADAAPANVEPAWHVVLGVDPHATREQLHAAYRRRIDEYDPASVAALGPDLRVLAEARLKQINDAYDAGVRAIAQR